ncbi:hypothetical protein JX265_007588 [Neoarthrinium moseri]|uniref:Uncharacterized protein n=1 Tax=Neoarthrinium moseri TaxID=1658444 RepID=A0A9Q0APM2_9PEZI|nr:uncharacterized protein JN550_013138 [Neoarthrinium moseri]KAI1854541.1 hypothetical protein JX266_000659 [Neoarthrinium moseri]KAI1857569.1 hypothetical protein JN550_013138 [Neoarthrinium moseri]KAI1867012.1 hypothetical protein JX265_007588 [Neoarthrinium moseri]
MGSGRSSKKAGKVPAPLSTSTSRNTNARHESFGSTSSGSTFDWAMERSNTADSWNSSTAFIRHDSSSAKAVKPVSPTANVYTHCGRHSDQWLFGGTSMSSMIKSAWKKE